MVRPKLPVPPKEENAKELEYESSGEETSSNSSDKENTIVSFIVAFYFVDKRPLSYIYIFTNLIWLKDIIVVIDAQKRVIVCPMTALVVGSLHGWAPD